jgi:hypothetical protein
MNLVRFVIVPIGNRTRPDVSAGHSRAREGGQARTLDRIFVRERWPEYVLEMLSVDGNSKTTRLRSASATRTSRLVRGRFGHPFHRFHHMIDQDSIGEEAIDIVLHYVQIKSEYGERVECFTVAPSDLHIRPGEKFRKARITHTTRQL